MPPLPRISSPVLVELARELRFAPAPTLLRTVERAEALAVDIDPDATLPGEWVVFRLTGYRPERWPENLQTVQGRDVLAGLSALTELLCDRAELSWADVHAEGAVDRADLAAKWSVSQKTVDRLKSEGLIARRARREDGKVVVAFMPAVIAAAQRKHQQRIDEARATTRLTKDERRWVIAVAERYRRRFGASLNRTAEALATRIGRGRETVRELLQAEDARRAKANQPPIFGDAGPVQDRSRRWMERAWRRGAEPADLARHARCGRPAVQRAINLQRHGRLADLVRQGVLTGEIDRRAFDAVPELKHPKAVQGLGRPGITDLGYFLESSRARIVVTPRDEHAALAAYRTLRSLAAAWTTATPALNPQSEPIDHAETALRWASRIKAEIMRPLWTVAVDTIENLLGDRAETLGAARLVPLLSSLRRVLAEAVNRAEPGVGRVAGAAALELSTETARWLRGGDNLAAAKAKHSVAAGTEIADWTRHVDPWQAWLEPDHRLRPILASIDPDHARALSLRYGWADSRPRTQSETAAELGVSRVGYPRFERAAIRQALTVISGGR